MLLNNRPAPLLALCLAAAAVRMVASTGPMRGVQPKAKAMPNGNAPAGPDLIPSCRIVSPSAETAIGGYPTSKRPQDHKHAGDFDQR